MNVLLITAVNGDACAMKDMLLELPGYFSMKHDVTWEAGLNSLNTTEFGVVLLDTGLPDYPGLRSFVNIQHKFPHPAFIIVASSADEALAINAVRQGAEDYVIKEHLTGAALRQAVMRAVNLKNMRSALEKTAQTYELILDTVDDVIWMVDAEAKLVYINKRATECFGHSLDDMMGHYSLDFVPQELQPFILSKLNDRRNGLSDRYDVHLQRKDGSSVWISISSTPLFDENGKYNGIMGIASDISLRKQSEEKVKYALKESWRKQLEIEALLKSSRVILENSRFKDVAQDIFTFCRNLVGANDGYIALRSEDKPDKEVVLINTFDILSWGVPSDMMPVCPQHAEVYHTGNAVFYNDYKCRDGLNYLPDKVKTVDNILLAPLVVEGNPAGLVVLANKDEGFIDNDVHLVSGFAELISISLLNSRIWDSLQQSETKYKILVEASPDGVLVLDDRGKIVDCNEGLCQLIDHNKKEIKDFDIKKFLPAINQAKLIERLGNRKWFETEIEARRRDGRNIPIWAKGVGRFDGDGKINQVVLYIRDIVERKKLDQLKDDFVSLVSHEIRTPLTVIMGSLNTLSSEKQYLSTEEKDQLLKDAILETDSLSYLLGNLIELSRAQADKLSLNLEPVTIKSVIKRMVKKIQQQSPSHQMVIKLPPKLPIVQADQVKLERILYNLLENAVKYSPKGGEIRVSAKRRKKELVVMVTDQGIGISDHDQSKLFRLFEPLEHNSEVIEGAGLGLMVCRRLVEAHNGRIWVDSRFGSGSTFYFSLPL